MSASPLISVATLVPLLTDDRVVVFDCRHDLAKPGAGEQAYAISHLPGARFAHLDRNLSGPMTGRNGRHPLPDPAVFTAWLGTQGVSNQTRVIAYDGAGSAYAARLWWMLSRWLGHRDVLVLDGGWEAWAGSGQPVTAAPPTIKPVGFVATADPATVVGANDVLAAIGNPALQLIDARANDRFHGQNETIDPVAGHIPGALNRVFRDNLDAAGFFKPAGELRAGFESLIGTRPLGAIVHQCGSGVTAAHNLLAMEIAGMTGTRLYPGSWSEWCADPARPVER